MFLEFLRFSVYLYQVTIGHLCKANPVGFVHGEENQQIGSQSRRRSILYLHCPHMASDTSCRGHVKDLSV